MIECPANYFGKGEDYILPDDQNVIQDMLKKMEDYEASHPDDPTGEKALAAYKQENPDKRTSYPSAPEAAPPVLETPKTDLGEDFEIIVLELQMKRSYVRILKNFAKLQRKRPRDVVEDWIHKYAKL